MCSFPRVYRNFSAILLTGGALCFPVSSAFSQDAATQDFSVQGVSVVVDTTDDVIDDGIEIVQDTDVSVPVDAVLSVVDDAAAAAAAADRGDGDVFSAEGGNDSETPAADVFYDAEMLAPAGEMAKSGPVKVDPMVSPASKMVVVRKNYTEDSYTAGLVSAERAMKLGRYDSALVLLDNLAETNKRDPRVHMARAVALQKLGRFDEAMAAYEATEKLEQDNIDVKINMLGLLGTRYPSIALRRLLDLHEKNQTHVGLIAQIAIVEAQLGDFHGAMKYLGMAAGMEPSNAGHYFNMAVIADRAGETAQAVSYYEKALELDAMAGAGKTIPRESVYERLAQIR